MGLIKDLIEIYKLQKKGELDIKKDLLIPHKSDLIKLGIFICIVIWLGFQAGLSKVGGY